MDEVSTIGVIGVVRSAVDVGIGFEKFQLFADIIAKLD